MFSKGIDTTVIRTRPEQVFKRILPIINNHCEKKQIKIFSDRSYRNRKSHEIWGHLEAIFWVLIELLKNDLREMKQFGDVDTFSFIDLAKSY